MSDNWLPDTSWQDLDQQARSKLATDLNAQLVHRNWYTLPFDRLRIQTLRELETARVRNIETFRSVHESLLKDLSQTEYGFLAINWNYPDPEITRAFAKWLSGQRQDREKRGMTEIKHKPKNRGGSRDRLRWLGALRVVQHYRTSQLVDYKEQETKLKVDAPYRHSPDLYDGAKKARQLLEGVKHC